MPSLHTTLNFNAGHAVRYLPDIEDIWNETLLEVSLISEIPRSKKKEREEERKSKVENDGGIGRDEKNTRFRKTFLRVSGSPLERSRRVETRETTHVRSFVYVRRSAYNELRSRCFLLVAPVKLAFFLFLLTPIRGASQLLGSLRGRVQTSSDAPRDKYFPSGLLSPLRAFLFFAPEYFVIVHGRIAEYFLTYDLRAARIYRKGYNPVHSTAVIRRSQTGTNCSLSSGSLKRAVIIKARRRSASPGCDFIRESRNC